MVDAVVVGTPDERWGERVTAIVQPATRAGDPHWTSCGDELRVTLADYKLPRQLVVVDEMQRLPSGKADYAWANARVASAGRTPADEPEVQPWSAVTGMDAAFLDMETSTMHLHVVGVLVLDPGEIPVDELTERLRSVFVNRLHLIPPFRWRVVTAPGGLGDPRWVEDPAFDLARHLHRATMRPGSRSVRPRAVRRRPRQPAAATRPTAVGDLAGRRLRRRDRGADHQGPPRHHGRCCRR